MARTQKALGILRLVSADEHPNVKVLDVTKPDPLAGCYARFPTFARPCPMRPRHGFVDSRVVTNVDELLRVIEETRAADPKGEVVLAPVFHAVASAILTPTTVRVGPGNDGATGNSPTGLTLPVSSVKMPNHDDLIATGEVPYVEAVFTPDTLRLVQIRSGPPCPGVSGDWIPERVKVTQVLKAEGDLLAWEDVIQHATPGLVVWLPGGSLLSHYAVHAVSARIPVVLGTTAPTIGRVLRPTVLTPMPGEAALLRAFLEGLAFGRHADLNGQGFLSEQKTRYAAVAGILYTVHQWSSLAGTLLGARLLGVSVALLVRLGAAACVGESRHGVKLRGWRSVTRDEVYHATMSTDARNVARQFARARWSFRWLNWGGGYGGSSWARVAIAVTNLATMARRALLPQRDEQRADLPRVFRELNILIHLAHNNGWWLNKYASANLADEAANGAVKAVLWGAAGAYAALTSTRRRVASNAAIAAWLDGFTVPEEEVDYRSRKHGTRSSPIQVGGAAPPPPVEEDSDHEDGDNEDNPNNEDPESSDDDDTSTVSAAPKPSAHKDKYPPYVGPAVLIARNQNGHIHWQYGVGKNYQKGDIAGSMPDPLHEPIVHSLSCSDTEYTLIATAPIDQDALPDPFKGNPHLLFALAPKPAPIPEPVSVEYETNPWGMPSIVHHVTPNAEGKCPVCGGELCGSCHNVCHHEHAEVVEPNAMPGGHNFTVEELDAMPVGTVVGKQHESDTHWYWPYVKKPDGWHVITQGVNKHVAPTDGVSIYSSFVVYSGPLLSDDEMCNWGKFFHDHGYVPSPSAQPPILPIPDGDERVLLDKPEPWTPLVLGKYKGSYHVGYVVGITKAKGVQGHTYSLKLGTPGGWKEILMNGTLMFQTPVLEAGKPYGAWCFYAYVGDHPPTSLLSTLWERYKQGYDPLTQSEIDILLNLTPGDASSPSTPPTSDVDSKE
jgi:hypothetical protein